MIDVRVDIADAIQAVSEHLHPLVDELAKGETVAAVARKTGRSRRRVFRDLDALGLVGLLNSAAACFWMKQVRTFQGSGSLHRGLKR